MSDTILIVDDEADIRNLIKGILTDEGYKVVQAATAREAYEQIDRQFVNLVILDIWLQGSEHDGLQVLANIKKRQSFMPVIMISGHGTIETAVSSIKQGAYDFIEKPFKSDRLLVMIRRALETARLRQENESLKKQVARPAVMAGNSTALQNLRQILERVASSNSRVLLTGEAGAGKDIAARMIHALSPRAGRPFHVINCATLRPDRLEPELFGSDEPGNERPGAFEQANGGTIFLDEVSDMPLETQGKIIRVLQEQKLILAGGKREVDVRIIASTNRDLEKAVSEGKFRQDLYYRLNVVPINITPLRERTDDIPLLIKHFVHEISQQSGLPERAFTNQAMVALQTYSWPGNVRQLRNAVEWAMIMKGNNGEGALNFSDLPPDIAATTGSAAPSYDLEKVGGNFMMLPLREAREIFERDYLLSQIGRFGGNISKTAQFVGMERSALHRKLKSLNIGERGDDDVAHDNVSPLKKRASRGE